MLNKDSWWSLLSGNSQKVLQTWVGIYSLHKWYVCDMFDKNEASWSWSLENFSTKTIAYHGRSQQKHRKQKHTGFLSKKNVGNAPPFSMPHHLIKAWWLSWIRFPLSKVRLKYCISSWPVGLWNQVLSIDRCGVWNRDLSRRVWVMKDKSFLDVFSWCDLKWWEEMMTSEATHQFHFTLQK